MPSHTFRRDGGVYYTRMVVPPRLRSIIGKTDIGRSLRTSDHKEMMRLQPVWLSEALSIIDAAERELSRQQASGVSNLTPYDPFAAMTEEELGRQLEHEAEEARQIGAEDDAWEDAQAWELGLAAEHPAVRLLADARIERDRYRGRYHARKQRDQQQGSSRREPEPAFWVKPVAKPAITITEMFEGYAAQDGTKEATASQFRAIIKHLVSFLGHDDAQRVELQHLVKWREHLRVELVKGRPRTAKTINGSYLAVASVTFAYGVNQLLIPSNPTHGLAKVRAAKAAKLRDKDFTHAERMMILTAALRPVVGKLSAERAFAQRWVPWLCAYTGARVNEMTQLRREDVQMIDGVWTLLITPEAGGVKTNEARIVPVHEHLIAQGFITAIEAKPQGPLFYSPSKERGGSVRGQHKKVGMFLAEWVRTTAGVTDPAVQPNHAWRHTFKTIAFEAGVDERAADYIQGHASKGQGRKYGSNTIPALAAQLRKFPRFNLAD